MDEKVDVFDLIILIESNMNEMNKMN